MVESKEATQDSVLIIEDDELFLKTLTNLLKKEGYEVEGAKTGPEAIEKAKEKYFDLIISDVRLPGGMDGLEVLKNIKDIYNYPNKMIIMTGYADEEAPVRAIRLGVDDYIYKPFRTEDFLQAVSRTIKISRLQKYVDYYRQLSIHDGLTNLFNHRYFHEIIVREIDRASRYNHPFSLFMIDIDNFKHFNDTHGHLAGDMALKKIANLFIKFFRKVDFAFRYGGEEFIIILPETHKEGALVVAERIRKTVEETSFEVDHTLANLTVSIGVAIFPEDAKDKEALVQNADKALYRAKQSGKNRIG
jgi:diguanylate cyclase (GGDEF)-like protein